MTEPRIALGAGAVAAADLARGLAAIREELALPAAFPDAVLAEAGAGTAEGHPSAASWLVGATARIDRTDLPFVTLDPLGSRDLDQALHIEPGASGGFTLHYAIADVAAHVQPGGTIDHESRARGETVYLPGERVPLHPPALSEDAASLLPGVRRLAVLWTLSVDAAGELQSASVERAIVRSTAQLDYAGAQAALDAGSPHAQVAQLARLGPVLVGAARRRGAIELPEPSQELVKDAGGSGDWQLAWLPRHPLEDWNAQLSLLTGRAAAAIMLRARSGLLRTLPPPPAGAEDLLRLAAQALGVDWPAAQTLPERLASLDAGRPEDLALIDRSRALLRGAGYLPLVGQGSEAAASIHSAVAAPYAHVTAPLRRLADRFATEAVLAAESGVELPQWVAAALPELPDLMKASGRRSGSASRSVVDLAEAIVLAPRVGETFEACVVEVEGKGAEIRIVDPPVRGRADGAGLTAGTQAQVELTVADPVSRRVHFANAAA